MRQLGEAQTKLVAALREAAAPAAMIDAALDGLYDDFRSDHDAPISVLVHHALRCGLKEIATRAKNGEFDGTKADAQAWAQTPEGMETVAEFSVGVVRAAKP